MQTKKTPSKTICFFSGDITRCGGTEKASTMIANLFKRQGKHKVIFLSLVEKEPEPFFALDEGISRYQLSDTWINPGLGYIKLIPRLRKFLKAHDVDVLIDIDIVLGSLSIPAAKKLKTKVILWEHFNYQFEQSTLYRRLILKYSIKRSDYVVTLTERDKSMYSLYLNRSENISTIYNPIEEPIRDLNVKKERWILTNARLVAQKGVDYLIEVAKNVLKKHPDWKWILLGEGDLQAFAEEEIRKNQLEDQLILKGKVKNVGDYLERSLIYVMTSRFEGLPMCLLEAKAYELPCVSFDIVAGPAELIIDQVNGFLVPAFSCAEMEEKIERLMDDEELRNRFAQHAKLDSEKFRAEHILQQWDQIIEQLCE